MCMLQNIMNKKISVVIPVYNEVQTIEKLLSELQKLPEHADFEWEYIFVDDGSNDESLKKIEVCAKTYSQVCFLAFTRNFGKEAAVAAGIEVSSGDAVVIIDADLQHPPAIISEFIKKWNDGALVVSGVRTVRQHDGVIRKAGSRIFYGVMSLLTHEKKMQVESTDFRLLDRIVVSEFLRLKEHRRLNRSLIDWLGFQSVDVRFDVADRSQGSARYSYSKLTKTAIGAIVSNSQIPLSLAGYLGCLITFFAGFLGLFIIVEQLILKDPWRLNASASAMMAVFILFLNGIVLMCLGLISLYIGSIHEESLGRPLYVVGKRSSFSSNVSQRTEKEETN